MSPSGAELRLRTEGPEDTRRLAATVAEALRAGDVVSLTGELGAGKTCFVKGAAAALGVEGSITSPSFLLRRDYGGRVPVVHLDVYRLETFQELLDLGYEEVIDDEHVSFIEWGDAVNPLLPADHLEVELRLGDPLAGNDGAEERTVLLRAHGDDWRRRLAALANALEPWRDGTGGSRC